jgi:sigma-B regulation protein RsbU (phosphoserine phosphatase)
MHSVKQNATNLALSTVHSIDGVLEAAEKIPDNLAPIIENSEYDEKNLQSFLKPIVRNNQEIFGSCVAFEPYTYAKDRYFFAPYYYKENDSIKYKILGDSLYNYFYLDWYQIPKMLDKPVWTEPYFDENGGNIIMSTYSVPFYKNQNKERKFKGIVTVDIDLSWLSDVIDSLNIINGGYAYLLSKRGTFLSHPDKSLIMNESIFSLADEYDDEALRNIGREMISGKSGFIRYNPIEMKGPAWMYYTTMPSSGWSIAIVFPEKELLSDLHFLFRTLIALIIGGILLIFIVITLVSSHITRPIEKLAKLTGRFGKGNFDINLPPVKYNDEIGQLTGSFDLMRKELKRYIKNLEETTAAKNRIESELKIAHDIQQGIIPKIFPPFPEREDVDLFAVLDPAKEVGGDLYDFFFLDDKKIVFAIGDVSGKGVPASLFMAITRTLFRAKAVKGESASNIVTNINKELCKDNENAMFVTFFLGILDLETGEIDFCNAGHNYPYLLQSGHSPEILKQTHGTPLGLFEDIKYGSGKITISRGDSMVLYTDGIPEAMDINGTLFGDEKLKEILQRCNPSGSPKQITDMLLAETKAFTGDAPQSDDITILVLTYYQEKHSRQNEMTLEITNHINEINKLNELTDEMCRRWNLAPSVGHKINLALEEIISNIINYGFTDDDEHIIRIEVTMANDTLKITTIDDGKQFNPVQKKDPETLDKPIEERQIGGLGIYFVKQFMDHVEYSRKDGKNILIIEKNIRN